VHPVLLVHAAYESSEGGSRRDCTAPARRRSLALPHHAGPAGRDRR
jgi:hypothetical protein